MSLTEVLAIKKGSLEVEEKPDGLINLASIGDDEWERVEKMYGKEGLFRLFLLATGHSRFDFEHFHDLAYPWWEAIAKHEVSLAYDNGLLPATRDLDRFASNVLQPSLSRKLYRPGRNFGHIVYGIGGPRILVSHPFRGGSRYHYDLYNNSVDVVTSLMTKGYNGTFLFLDYLPGLHYEAHGLPAWLVWFSKIAVHSDLVLFITEGNGELTPSQAREGSYTPDRVWKKIVRFPKGELSWAKIQPADPSMRIYHEGKKLSWEEYLEYERKYSQTFVAQYVRDDIPNDRIICLNEEGEITQYPLNWPIYQLP